MGGGDLGEERWRREPSSERPSPPFAAKELLEQARLDFIANIRDEEAQWDYLVAFSLCDEYDVVIGTDLLQRWFETGPSVGGKRASEYVEAIRAGREVRERVTVQKRRGVGRGGEDV
jgi:hypothetical protein